MKKNERKAFVFPGQGSQFKGMGKELFSEFKEITAQADEILGYSIEELCMEDKDNKLNQTQYTQPALYIVNALSYLHELEIIGEKPDYTAGHSLGEYNALLAAGAFDFATGLRMVMRRGELMSKAKNGGMMAVIGATYDQLVEIINEKGLTAIDLANLNTKYQTILSGKSEDLEAAAKIIEEYKKIRCIKLNTSGAFHSRYMEEAKKSFVTLLDTIEFHKLEIPVISNFTARPYKQTEIKDNLEKQLTGSVKWLESMRYLMGKGVTDICQVGPGTVLTNMIAKIKMESEPLIVEDEEEENQIIGMSREITVSDIGSKAFKEKYRLKYPYVCEAMYSGISSAEMIVKLAGAGMLGFLGTRGLKEEAVRENIETVQRNLNEKQIFGVNLSSSPYAQKDEESLIQMFLEKNVELIEASEFMSITKGLIQYRLHGVRKSKNDKLVVPNHIIAKVSRLEIAELFLCPPPVKMVHELLEEGKITKEEAGLAKDLPMADGITVTCDSEGHIGTSAGFLLVPVVKQLVKKYAEEYGYDMTIDVGTAGGIGDPQAAAAAFISGADYVATGSINQCTMEAAVSEEVKRILEKIDIHDTEYVPDENLFALGAKCQVVRKGLFFPARANKLYEIYRHYDSIEELDLKLASQLKERYFRKDFEQIYEEVKSTESQEEIAQAMQDGKYKMLLIFKWYFKQAREAAIHGYQENKVNYQIKCSSAMGFFNHWAKGKVFENWENRHVDQIGRCIMEEAAELLNRRYKDMLV